MGAMTDIFTKDEEFEFFAPAATDMIDGLIGQYESIKKRIDGIADMVTGEIAGAMYYFLDGNGRDSRYGVPSVHSLFDKSGAMKSLNSAYWSKAMQLTDVLNYMPQARRDEWNKSITEQSCPEFEEETVRSTLMGLLNMRSQFLAERVDGIFRGLSGEHVTNSPAAFGKRMIVGYILNEYHHETHSKCGLINDLRCVIAKFMGRDEPNYNASSGLIRTLKGRWGEWVSVDGGALKIRLYKKGTAHIEVHPDMAWRLNSILAHMHPMAIPSEFRTKPKKKAKEFDLMQRPLPFAVIDMLASFEPAYRFIKTPEDWRNPYRKEPIKNAIKLGSYQMDKADKAIKSEVESILKQIGGVKTSEGYWQFDYPVSTIMDDIISSGCVPDHKSHQFYPTPAKIAEMAVEIAAIEDHHTCLEPSAGTGGIADFLPNDRTTCVEVSKLHADILSAKGCKVVCEDFIAWATGQEKFDRIVMNPPFSEGRWQAHLNAAAELVKPNGRLVAILPVSAKGKDLLPGFNCWYPQTFDNEFSGTSISVVILVAQKK